MTMPMAVLVAVLYAFSRLAAENEITAMKASGVGMRTVLMPVLLGGFAMSLVMIAFNDQVLPRANHRLAVLQMDIFRTKPTFALREQVINTVKEGQLYLKAGDIDEGSSRMKDVVIYDLTDPMRRRTIYADSGNLALSRNRSDLDLTLYHGVMQEIPNNKKEELTRLFYTSTVKRVKGVFSSYQESRSGTISKGDREMSVCEMQKELERADYQMRHAKYEVALAEFENSGQTGKRPEVPVAGRGTGPGLGKVYCRLVALISVRRALAEPVQGPGAASRGVPQRIDSARPPAPPVARPSPLRSQAIRDTMESRSVRQERNFRWEEARRERNRYDVEIQKKFSLAASCMIFVLVGAPIALRFPRGGVGLVIGVSFAIFGVYYVGLIGGETLADKGYLPPWVAMWGANIMLLILGLGLASQMGRESTTARGGDFAELLATARTRVFGWLRLVGVPVERRRA
jgi:lipopolysaccharide export system permease protein